MSESGVIILGVFVQIVTLLGVIFAMGRFTGKTTTVIENLQIDVTEMKLDMKTHLAQDVSSFRDLTKDINDIKISIERKKLQ